ncbi:FAD dependent oxidoreductase-domain-containing protein [Coprinopsis sp. MPI-PUGE-AT-0042]|nr:FAD dependent oxidoreductase-domain-containing protein [Coprinopsis sp. MPI-PUGE-AT-0042]
MRLGTEIEEHESNCFPVILLTTQRMTSISLPNQWPSKLSTVTFSSWKLRLLLLATTLMAKPSLSVPLRQFELSQVVLDSYHGDVTSPSSLLNNRPLPDPQPVSLPVSKPTKSFWVDSPGANPLAREGSEGDLTNEADVCIIGSGITGVSAAWHLAGMLGGGEGVERRVVVLEARGFCSGATGRNGGHLTPSVFLDFHNREVLYGAEEAIKSYKLENYTAESLVRFIQDDELEDELDLVHGRHVTLFVTPEEEALAKVDFEAAQKAGLGGLESVKFVDGETMEKTRGSAFPGVEMPGHNLWPLKLVTMLFEKAQKRSKNVKVVLHTQTPVISLSSSSEEHSHELVTPRGSVRCKYVIHATNGYVNHLLSPQKTGIRVVPTRGQVIATRAKVPTHVLGKNSWDANEGFEYWFPRPIRPAPQRDGTGQGGGDKGEEAPLVILGGGREVSGPKFELYETNDGEVNESVGKALRGFLPPLFPGMYPLPPDDKVEWEWTGIMGYTRLGHPFVGPVVTENGSLDGHYVAAGFTGHGMPRTYACGEAVASMIAAKLLEQEWKQPEWLPDHYLTSRRSV